MDAVGSGHVKSWGGRPRERSAAPSRQGPNSRQGVGFLVLCVMIDVKALARQGRNYPWQKPPCCPCCAGPLWWHGFVPAYLAGLFVAVFLRRLYCPFCKSVHRLRPTDHWRRFQSAIPAIRESIAHRAQHGRWRTDLPRPRQRQWWRRLGWMIKAVLGLSFSGSLLDGFDAMVGRVLVPVGSVIDSGRETVRGDPTELYPCQVSPD